MISSEPSPRPITAPASVLPDQGQRQRALQIAFATLILLLAVFQFSENTADPDLWGHITFGQEMLRTHSIPKTDSYSWTARGQPWVNHECLAEISLGAAHNWFGGSGVLLLKMLVGLLTFLLALRLGLSGIPWPGCFIGWAFAALAVVEISYGFAPRPQIFTALCLAIELALLRRIHAGSYRWAIAMPFLFALWINTHGGVLAGLGLLGLAAGMSTLQLFYDRFRPKPSPSSEGRTTPTLKTIVILWLVFATSGVAMLFNPWKAELIRWLIRSVLWLRPEIAEWNPTPFNWDHAAFFLLVALAFFAWIFTRRSRLWWEAAACAAFAVLALRAVRNTPLCCIVLLTLATPHLVDALGRFRHYFERSSALFQSAAIQKLALVIFVCLGLGIGVSIFTLHKEHPLTMEAPSVKYPNGAIAFLSKYDLRGRMLVFFDWGEMVIFHLPECPPSIDGRLDTCYSRALIAAHWKFYNAEPFDESVLNPNEADLALLQARSMGAQELAGNPGWQPIYYDETAVLLARNRSRFQQLAGIKLPVQGPKITGLGRVALADRNPRWK